MLQSLKNSFQKTNKTKLLRDALLYHQLKEVLSKELPTIYPDFTEDFQQTEVFFREHKYLVEIKLRSTNFAFMTWLKTECYNISKVFESKLKSKNIISELQEIELKCSGK